MKRTLGACCVIVASLAIGCAAPSNAGSSDGCAGASAVAGYDVPPPVDDGWWMVGDDGSGYPSDPGYSPPCDPSTGCGDGSSGGADNGGSPDPGAVDNGGDPSSGDPSSGDGSGSDGSGDGSGDDGSGDSSDMALHMRGHHRHATHPRYLGAPMCATCSVVCMVDSPAPGEPPAIAAVGSSATTAGACLDAQRQLADYARNAFGRRITTCGPDTGQPLTSTPVPPPPGRVIAQPVPAARTGVLR